MNDKITTLTRQFLDILGSDSYQETMTYEDEPGTCLVNSSTHQPDISDFSKVEHDILVGKASHRLLREWCLQKFGIDLGQLRHAKVVFKLQNGKLQVSIQTEAQIQVI